MELQILDVDYIMVGERPVIRILGKDQEGQVVCGFYEGFLPYFYVEGDVEKCLADNPLVLKIEKVQRKSAIGWQDSKEMWKITISHPAKTPELRELLKSKGLMVYEADILFKYRFLADFGLNGFGWVKIEKSNGVSTTTVFADKKVQITKIKPIEREQDVTLKIMAVDIECVPIQQGFIPEASKDPVVIISLVFNTDYKGKKSIILSTRNGEGVAGFETEKEMLEEFVNILKDYDPDIITGYNVNNYDLPYMLERMKRNNIRPVLGRCNDKLANAMKLTTRFKINIYGRIVVDSFEIVKKDYSLKRYDLNTVAGALLKQKKEDVKHSEIEKFWKGNQESFIKLVNYSRKDAKLALSLVEELNLLDKYIALSKVSGVLLQDTLNGGETTRIEHYVLKEFNKKGYVLPNKPDPVEMKNRIKMQEGHLMGGFVIEPDKGVHSSVIVLDFTSMYPSIIRTFNICTTTLVKEKRPEETIKAMSGAEFITKEVQPGIIPEILENLMNARKSVKRRLKEGGDKTLYAKQWALKIMANAFYGHIGYHRSKIYSLDVANAITSYGRYIIQRTRKNIESKYGYRVVYGDTDSVMVKVPETDIEKIAEIGQHVSSYITKQLPGIMELEFDKIFKKFLPLTKKRYVALWLASGKEGWEEGTEMKGVETVRRDWCELVSDTMRDVVEIILKKDDKKEAINYFRGIANSLMKGEIPIQKLVITKTITKQPKSYAGIQPHVELAKKIQIRSPREAPGVGDRIGYVIIKGTGLLSKRAEDPIYVIEKGLQVDSRYYIENQLLPPIERIFKAIEVKKSELVGNGRQMGLLDQFIFNGNGHGQQVLSEIPIEEMTGVACVKCSRAYQRVPLIGTCECGGGFLFSSPKGLAEAVVVGV